MMEPMPTFVEVWPLAADAAGMWCPSGPDCWTSDRPVPSDSLPLWEVRRLLGDHEAGEPVYLHQTSCRAEMPSSSRQINTFIAVLPVDGDVLRTWQDAMPITKEGMERVGPSGPGPAVESPTPRPIDVLLHGAVGHLADLIRRDAGARVALGPVWQAHLKGVEPTFATWYEG